MLEEKLQASVLILQKQRHMQYNQQQVQALEMIGKFLQPYNPDKAFILRGSAGTGKTTLMNAVAGMLSDNYEQAVIVAPTNKAAKVLSKKTGKYAKTLHSLLYEVEPDKNGYGIRLCRKNICYADSMLFIVDEASMVGDRIVPSREFVCETPLLTDLLQYVSVGNPCNKILFVGDPCQLPPIGYRLDEESPALFPRYFEQKFGISSKCFELNEIVRQHRDSYILKGAQLLRTSIQEHNPHCSYPDIN